MSKKNLPNIPIYIGDWERDCNVLSLESEAAWMRVVFKLWTKGKQNSIKMPTKALQNLWRCSVVKMQEILDELIYNEIADIEQKEGFVTFTCRRFVKENNLSKIRSDASKSDKSSNNPQTKPKQNVNKSQSKNKQNTENEIDYEKENERFKKLVLKSSNLISKIEANEPFCIVSKKNIPLTDLDFERMLGDWAGQNHLVPFDDTRHVFNSFRKYLEINKPSSNTTLAMANRVKTDHDYADFDELSASE